MKKRLQAASSPEFKLLVSHSFSALWQQCCKNFCPSLADRNVIATRPRKKKTRNSSSFSLRFIILFFPPFLIIKCLSLQNHYDHHHRRHYYFKQTLVHEIRLRPMQLIITNTKHEILKQKRKSSQFDEETKG